MKLIRVEDKAAARLFHDTGRIIYKDDPVWVCPLDREIEAIFDPEKNSYFRSGEATRFILVDDELNPIGRIAAFIDRNLAQSYDQPTGGIGFFECINDKDGRLHPLRSGKGVAH